MKSFQLGINPFQSLNSITAWDRGDFFSTFALCQAFLNFGPRNISKKSGIQRVSKIQGAIIQFIGSPTSDPPIFSWKSLKDHQTCPKIHFRGFRYLKRGPLQGVLDFMKILKKIHKNLKYGLEPPILVRASSVIPFRKALAIPVAGLYSNLSSQP